MSEAGIADAKFTHGSTLRHVVIMSLTSSLGIIALFTVDLIDMVFVSMLGQDALAAAAGYEATVPLVILGGMYFGAPGVLMGQALGQMLFSILAVVFARHVIANPAEKLQMEPFQLHRRNHQIYCRGNR